MPYALTDDLRLYFELEGEGERLLFFNGSGQDLRIKPNIFDGPLAKRFQLLSLDHRGTGQSEKPNRDYIMADFANDGARVLDFAGWERCHVFGYSFGGMVAQEFAIRHSDRVNRLVLGATSSGGEGKPSFPLHQLAELSVKDRIRTLIAILDTRHNDAWQKANPDDVIKLAGMMNTIQQLYGKEHNWAIGRDHQMQARAGHDCWDRLPMISALTLVCAGLYDGIAPLANSEAIVSQIPGAKLQVFEGGHRFIQEDKNTTTAIIEFLGN